MILVRNVFRLKFGKAREGVAAMKDTVASAHRAAGHESQMRLLTDLTGDFYTLVLERAYPGLKEFEETAHTLMSDPQWQAAYRTLMPLVESGYREMFRIVDL